MKRKKEVIFETVDYESPVVKISKIVSSINEFTKLEYIENEVLNRIKKVCSKVFIQSSINVFFNSGIFDMNNFKLINLISDISKNINIPINSFVVHIEYGFNKSIFIFRRDDNNANVGIQLYEAEYNRCSEAISSKFESYQYLCESTYVPKVLPEEFSGYINICRTNENTLDSVFLQMQESLLFNISKLPWITEVPCDVLSNINGSYGFDAICEDGTELEFKSLPEKQNVMNIKKEGITSHVHLL